MSAVAEEAATQVYLRHSARVKNGKQHSYWRLVRSVRRGGKVIQETVAQLGELDAEERAHARLLAQQITDRAHQHELFEATAPEAQRVAVRLDRVCLERARSFGGVWLGWKSWGALKLDELCAELMPEGREAVPWAQVAAVLVIARLTEPSSELHIAEAWYRTTALEDLLGLPAERVDDNRLYHALDRLLPHKPALEQHLRRRLGELFALEYDLLLYDVTSTYFEGLAEGNPLARRGYSRDHRGDCKQVAIHHAGGDPRGDAAGLRAVRRQSRRCHHGGRGGRAHGSALRSGPAHLGNGSRHDQRREPCVAGADRAALPDPARRAANYASGHCAIAETRYWQSVRAGVEAKLCAGPDGQKTFVLCRSVERRKNRRCMSASHNALNRVWSDSVGASTARARRWNAAS